MPDLLMLDGGVAFGRGRDNPFIRANMDIVDIYDLPEIDLSRYAGIVVTGLADQEFLFQHRARLRAALEEGAVVCFSGHIVRPWLPGCSNFVPSTIRSADDYRVRLVRPHPIFEGVDLEELVVRRGVLGFFARGWYAAPPGAEVILTMADGNPTLYIDQVTTRGTILVHGGNDLLGYAGAPDSGGRLAQQLLDWMRAQYAARSTRRNDA